MAELHRGGGCDNGHGLCRVNDKPQDFPEGGPSLPRDACLPINRCNLPAAILGSLTFQRHPSPLRIDGVAELHRDLFPALDRVALAADRAHRFMDYMTVHFRLEHLDEAGLDRAAPQHRGKANYLRLLRGWGFDSDSREGAVLKGWAESRFGLLPRFHHQPLRDFSDVACRAYLEERAAGLYGTNALETQIDLLYTYCQYELTRARPGGTHLLLYRGANRLSEHETLSVSGASGAVLLLNNLNSFTASRERADEFGDRIAAVSVPLPKIFFHSGLLPGLLSGEDEYVVIGGLYRTESIGL
jgi:NAD+--dinitrogen-reductase ADP-D-ribosyltransferase